MSSVGDRVAAGAAWMIGLRFLQRSLGLISTVILARLLVPEDFGLVAMALIVYAFVEIIGGFGFDLALIRDQEAEDRHYHTAWTLNLAYKLFAALVIAVFAPVFAGFFGDPRVEEVLYVIAIIVAIRGLENIGVVAFRKELTFNREFNFRLASKVFRVAVTVLLAVLFANYWALVLGSLAGAVAGVLLSYWMHPFRPRFGLSGARELFNFSRWVLLHNFATYANTRGPDLIVGRMVGADALGLFRVSSDIAKLPSEELYAPIMRVVFPGFSKIAHDLPRLRRAYLSAQGFVTAATVPAAVGLVAVAEPLVWVLLGTNWLEAIPLIQVLGLLGVTTILHGNRYSLFMALGKPYWVFFFVFLHAVITLPLMVYMLSAGFGITEAVWAKLAASLLLMPPGVWLVCYYLRMRAVEFLAVVWRPVFCSAAMAFAIWGVLGALPEVETFGRAAAALAVMIPLGVTVYGGLMLLTWYGLGRPEGPETRVVEMAVSRGLIRGAQGST